MINIVESWVPEVQKANKDFKCVLVGCKDDIRNIDDDNIDKFREQNPMFHTYVECSAATPKNIELVFNKVGMVHEGDVGDMPESQIGVTSTLERGKNPPQQ